MRICNALGTHNFVILIEKSLIIVFSIRQIYFPYVLKGAIHFVHYDLLMRVKGGKGNPKNRPIYRPSSFSQYREYQVLWNTYFGRFHGCFRNCTGYNGGQMTLCWWLIRGAIAYRVEDLAKVEGGQMKVSLTTWVWMKMESITDYHFCWKYLLAKGCFLKSWTTRCSFISLQIYQEGKFALRVSRNLS